MEFRHLKSFIAIGDTLSFSKAAKSLFITQPALSQHISELEDELGVKLLTRTTRTVDLTPVGLVFLNAAKELLLQQENLISLVKEYDKHPFEETTLRIEIDSDRIVENDSLRYVLDSKAKLKSLHPGWQIFIRARSRMDSGNSNEARYPVSDNPDVLVTKIESDKLKNYADYEILDTECLSIFFTDRFNEYADKPLSKILADHTINLWDIDSEYVMLSVKALSNMDDVNPKIRFRETQKSINYLVSSGEGATILPEHSCPFRVVEGLREIKLPDEECRMCTVALVVNNENSAAIEYLKCIREMKERLSAFYGGFTDSGNS